MAPCSSTQRQLREACWPAWCFEVTNCASMRREFTMALWRALTSPAASGLSTSCAFLVEIGRAARRLSPTKSPPHYRKGTDSEAAPCRTLPAAPACSDDGVLSVRRMERVGDAKEFVVR